MTRAPLTDDSPFPYAPISEHAAHNFQGMRMAEVPAWYLDMFGGLNGLAKRYPDVIDYINRNRAAIDAELKEQGRI